MSFTGSAFRMTHMRAVGGAGVGRGSQGLLELGGGGAGREGQRCLLKQLRLRTCAPVGPGPISQSDPPVTCSWLCSQSHVRLVSGHDLHLDTLRHSSREGGLAQPLNVSFGGQAGNVREGLAQTSQLI